MQPKTQKGHWGTESKFQEKPLALAWGTPKAQRECKNLLDFFSSFPQFSHTLAPKQCSGNNESHRNKNSERGETSSMIGGAMVPKEWSEPPLEVEPPTWSEWSEPPLLFLPLSFYSLDPDMGTLVKVGGKIV